MTHVEAQVQRKALLVLAGDNSVTSYLDSLGHVSDVYELNGTAYSFTGSILRSHDFTDYTRVTKIGDEQRLLFNLAATGLSDILYSSGQSMDATVHEISAMVTSLSAQSTTCLPFSVSLARDRFHKYICKFLSYIFII